jgi:hypothetical protein
MNKNIIGILIVVVCLPISLLMGGNQLSADGFDIAMTNPETRAWYQARAITRTEMEKKKEQDLKDLKAARQLGGVDLFPPSTHPSQTGVIIEPPAPIKGFPHFIGKVRLDKDGEEIFVATAGPDGLEINSIVTIFTIKTPLSSWDYALRLGEVAKGSGWKKIFANEQNEPAE